MEDINKDLNKNTDSVEAESTEGIGDIRVANEVLSIVASLAAQEVNGVLSMSGSIADGINQFLGKENESKGVKIRFEGKLVNVSVFVNIEYGTCIPEVALEIQEKVKDAIEKMTGYEVQFVDVHVQGIDKPAKPDFDKISVNHEPEMLEEQHLKFFEEDD